MNASADSYWGGLVDRKDDKDNKSGGLSCHEEVHAVTTTVQPLNKWLKKKVFNYALGLLIKY